MNLLLAVLCGLPAVWALTCEDMPIKSYPFCDVSLTPEARAQDLAGRMTLDEKVSQLGTMSQPVPRLGVQLIDFGSEALHGVWASCVTDNSTGMQKCPTQFPSPMTMGASFNPDLWLAMSTATSTEARALYHTFNATGLEGLLGLTYYAPNINIMRDPRWGRSEEVPGEDPYLTGIYAYQFVKGMQEGQPSLQGGSSSYIKTAATCKHFFVYNLEKDTDPTDKQYGVDRHHFNAVVGAQDLAETYLPAFHHCVKANVASVMCSYNAINGIPACAHPALNATLRGEFQFKGYVASDCGAISEIGVPFHNYTRTPMGAVAAAMNAGVDSNCGGVYPKYVGPAVSNGTIPAAQLDRAVERLLTARFKLGLFDNSSLVPWQKIGLDQVNSAAHQQVASDLAHQGVVLLQNNETSGTPLLPLTNLMPNATIAMIGPNANATRNLLSGYHGSPPFLISPFVAMSKALGAHRVTYARGCNASDNDASHFDEALQVAIQADIVVLGLGLCGNNYPHDEDLPSCQTIDEAEGIDRSSINLPAIQSKLVKYILKANKPTVAFLMNAGPLDVSELKTEVPALLWAGYGGEYGGQAVADVLLGKYNPGGALPTTWYPGDFVDKMSYESMDMRAGVGRTYKFYTGTPVFPFGWGLSYSSFSLSWESPPPTSTSMAGSVTYQVRVSNTGKLAGDKVVLAYVTATQQSVVAHPPIRQLFGFFRVNALRAGGVQVLEFELSPEGRSLVSEDGTRVSPPGEYKVTVETGGANAIGAMLSVHG